MRNVSAIVCCSALIGLAPCSTARAESPSNTDVHKQYLSALSDLRNAGIPTTLAALYPAQPPEDQNAALIYLKLADGKQYPSTQAEDDALAVLKPSPTSTDWENAREFLAANAELVAEIHKAAWMPDCVVPGRSAAKDPAAVLFPEFAPIRRSARIIAVESLVLAHDGKYRDAVDNAALGFRFADHAYQEPVLIGWLVGAAVDAITLNNIEHIMSMSNGDPAVAAAADDAVSSDWHVHPIDNALRGEATTQVAEMNVIRSATPTELSQTYGLANSPANLNAASKSPAAWNDFVDANTTVIIRYFQTLIADTDEPYPTAAHDIKALDADIESKDGGDHTFSHISCPVFTGAYGKQAQLEARVALVHASAALFTYKSAHGSYPGSLDQAMPNVPVDPFDGAPIRYRPDGDGFVLYSVGSTGKYAGGSSTGSETVLRVAADGTVAWK